MLTRKKLSSILTAALLTAIGSEIFVSLPAFSQTSPQSTNSNSTVTGDFNNVFQTPNQNNAENSTTFNVPNIYPLDNPINNSVNTENDFGLNMSMGVNTLDASNVTVYLGLMYQPGRSDSHKARMSYSNQQTELLKTQKQIAEAQLQLLQRQIAEAQVKLDNLQNSSSQQTQPETQPKTQLQIQPQTQPQTQLQIQPQTQLQIQPEKQIKITPRL
jgi:hypothetical protein